MSATSTTTSSAEHRAAPLIWMDLEMTGLDPDGDVILEIATLVTDGDLEILAEGPDLVVHQCDEVLEKMSDWCKEHHGESGLTAAIRASQVSVVAAEVETLEFVARYCESGKSPLCGNSIGQDRRFLARYMPRLESFLHYRNIDVSSVKELVHRWYPDVPALAKGEKHRALEDIKDSLAELRYYRRRVFR
ncbi:MAG: oligoribonuclease [Nannocystaceae bacterium]